MDHNGLRISDSKIKLVQSLPVPNTAKKLQRTLGLFQFLRKFIPGFSKRTYHMRQNLLKGQRFQWTNECQEEFDYLVNAITTAPVLSPINFNKEFHIFTDSSYHGAAYAIFQYQQDNCLHPIAYGGKSLTQSQRHWTTLDIELFAAYCALKEYQNYIGNQTVHIFSDNISLVFLKNLVNGKPREKRMACF